MSDNGLVRTIYHIRDGAQTLYSLDAENALQKWPSEWSDQAWPESAGKGVQVDDQSAPIASKVAYPVETQPDKDTGKFAKPPTALSDEPIDPALDVKTRPDLPNDAPKATGSTDAKSGAPLIVTDTSDTSDKSSKK